MLRVGLTGGLASGKSFVAAEFERLGCRVLQADRVGRRILANDREARRLIAREFGRGVLAADGMVDRAALAAAAFSSPERLKVLNAIIHPRVFARIEIFFGDLQAQDRDAIGMVEAAIMIESGSFRRYQRIVLTSCPRGLQVERFLGRGGGSRADAEARIGSQMPLEEKLRHADYVIDTGGSKRRTLDEVRSVHRELRQEARAVTEGGLD